MILVCLSPSFTEYNHLYFYWFFPPCLSILSRLTNKCKTILVVKKLILQSYDAQFDSIVQFLGFLCFAIPLGQAKLVVDRALNGSPLNGCTYSWVVDLIHSIVWFFGTLNRGHFVEGIQPRFLVWGQASSQGFLW